MIEEEVCEEELEKQKITEYIRKLTYYWYETKHDIMKYPYSINNHMVYDYGHPYNYNGYTTKVDGLDICRTIECPYQSSETIGLIFKKTVPIRKTSTSFITVAHMDTDNLIIKCMREEDYPIIKKFAQHIKYKKLIKCWGGAK